MQSSFPYHFIQCKKKFIHAHNSQLIQRTHLLLLLLLLVRSGQVRSGQVRSGIYEIRIRRKLLDFELF
jgi:hypothetical protein